MRAVFILALVLAGVLGVARAWAFGEPPGPGETVTQYLTPSILQSLFPGADRIGDVGGTPLAATVYQADRPIGYIFSTWDVTRSRGFADRPLVLLVGLGLAGRITGAKLVRHAEAIGILGLRDEDFLHFPDQFTGYDIGAHLQVVRETISPAAGATPGHAPAKVDAIAHATTSSIFMSDAIVRGARLVARSRGILASANGRSARIDVDRFEPADWGALEATGAVAHLHLATKDVLGKLRDRGAAQIAGGDRTAGGEDPFLDLYVALLTPAGIGINILGTQWYDRYMYAAGRGTDDQMLLIAANGRFSVLGADWENADTIAPLQLVQGDKTIRLSAKEITTLPFLHSDGTPNLTERALVFLPGKDGLDPGRPWQIRLLVPGETADGKPVFADFTLPYRLPDSYLLQPVTGSSASENDADDSSSLAWMAIWRARSGEITVLGVALTALTAILFLQAPISRRPRLHRWIRIGFLSWTLVWLGWYAGAQLTVVLVITWIHSLVTDFRWDSLLADPLIAVISGFAIVSMFFWGRAAFCGWLCPFGALQELTNKAARGLRIPQLKIPVALHGRLVVAKYVLFVALVGISFVSWDLAMAGTEIEPFKAAIILRFMTEWPMVVYALALIAASLFVERFYCRFACPLGGGLAILGKIRVFNSLKRHTECGSRCRVCETVCPVGAIKRNGQINMNECFYCLDCQVTYYDDHTCPPMVWRRKLLERAPGPRPTPVRATSR